MHVTTNGSIRQAARGRRPRANVQVHRHKVMTTIASPKRNLAHYALQIFRLGNFFSVLFCKENSYNTFCGRIIIVIAFFVDAPGERFTFFWFLPPRYRI